MKGLVVERDPGDRLKTKTVTEGVFEDLEEEQELLALDLVKRVLTKTRGVLLQPLLVRYGVQSNFIHRHCDLVCWQTIRCISCPERWLWNLLEILFILCHHISDQLFQMGRFRDGQIQPARDEISW